MASIWPAKTLTGGGAGALDAIDGSLLSDGDGAVVVGSSTVYFYNLDGDSGAAESSPDVIAPDLNADNKRWLLLETKDLTDHASDSDAHHARYEDNEAVAAINADADHGATAPHDELSSKTIGFQLEHDNGTVTSNTTIDWNNANNQKITLGADVTFTFSNMDIGHKQLKVLQDSTGGRTPTLPAGKWPGGAAGSFSTAAGAEDILSVYYDGASYYFQLVKGWS
jgi:hypothetical protein